MTLPADWPSSWPSLFSAPHPLGHKQGPKVSIWGSFLANFGSFLVNFGAKNGGKQPSFPPLLPIKLAAQMVPGRAEAHQWRPSGPKTDTWPRGVPFGRLLSVFWASLGSWLSVLGRKEPPSAHSSHKSGSIWGQVSWRSSQELGISLRKALFPVFWAPFYSTGRLFYSSERLFLTPLGPFPAHCAPLGAAPPCGLPATTADTLRPPKTRDCLSLFFSLPLASRATGSTTNKQLTNKTNDHPHCG